MTFIGIDNGTSGALAALHPVSMEVVHMPTREVGDATFIDAGAVEDWLLRQYAEAEGQPLSVTFEQGQKQPKFGTKGNFANGYSFGVIQTVLDLASRRGLLRFQCVNPRTWQKLLFADMRGLAEGNTKGASVEVCRRRFPSFNLVPPGCRKPDDGWSDALCLAEYSRLTLA